MKKANLFLFFTAIAVSFCYVISSCSRDSPPENLAKGKLALNVGISVSVFDIYNSMKDATDAFPVTIYNSDDKLVTSFAHASDIPDSIALPVGDYYAIASSDNDQDAAFNNPYYLGSSGTFSIKAGEVTPVNITCSLANIMVTVVYSDNIKNAYSDYSTDVSDSTGDLVFGKNETRAGFFNAGPLHIVSNLHYTDAGGTLQTKTLTGDIPDPQPGKHYEIHIDASLINGNTILHVSLNDSVETKVITINENGQSDGKLAYGDLLITEIMYDPDSLPDASGEWIELYNNSNKVIDLKGLVIRRDTTADIYQINSDVLMSPGAYAVLAKSDSAADHVDYVYGSAINLTNSGAELSIGTYGTDGTDGTTICAVNYGADGFIKTPHGKSLQLDPSVTDADAAKLGTNWCVSTAVYSTGDHGTPGKANTSCAP